jgi:AcrR family transcriptional regulator
LSTDQQVVIEQRVVAITGEIPVEESSEPAQSVDLVASDDAPASRIRRTQVERTAESDQRMLQAAMRLIGQRGYRGTSLAAIGEASGYSRGLVTERFGSKAGLLWALVRRMLRAWSGEGRARSGAGHVGLPALYEMVDNHRRALTNDEPLRAFYALMFEALGPTPDLQNEFRNLHHAFRADIAKMLKAGIDAGVVRADINVDAQAVIVLGTLRGIAFQWLLEPDAIAVDAAYDGLKQNLQRTLSP